MMRLLGLLPLLGATLLLGCRHPYPSSRLRPATLSSAGTAPRATTSFGGTAFSEENTPFEQMTARAQSSGKPALLYFCAHWCGYCQKMNRETMSQGRVAQRIAQFPASRYDPDTPAGREVASRFGVDAFPTIVIVDGSGKELTRLMGFRSADDLLAQLSRF